MIHMHVGQCGCQLGDEFWVQMQKGFRNTGVFSQSKLQRASSGGARSTESTAMQLLPPAVFVDSEPKVVHHLRSTPRASNVVFEQSGRGNNWAFGYEGSERLCELTMDSVRQELERQRTAAHGFNIVHGLSGGTGSGLGSRIVARLREEYPKLCVRPCVRVLAHCCCGVWLAMRQSRKSTRD